jgi:hypothetical protein
MILLTLALAAQLGASPNKTPKDEKPETPPKQMSVTVKVGEQVRSPAEFAAMGVNCDDRKIVEVLDLGDHLEFKGLAPGKTLCALGRGKLAPQVIEINVTGP